MKIKKTISIILCLMFMLTLFCGFSSAVPIQLNVKKGDIYKITQSTDQKISMSAEGENMDINQSISMTYIYNVIDVDSDGTSTINVKYDSITQKITGNNVTEKYDSKKDSKKTDVQSLCFNSIIGQEFSFTLSKNGTILSVSGIDKIMENILSKVTELDATTKNALMTSLKQYIDNDAIKESLGQMTYIYPSSDVKVGDSWKNHLAINLGFPMEINNTMKLKKIKGDILNIDIKSKINTSDSAKALDVAGIKIKYNVVGNQSGTFKINKSNVFIQNGSLIQTLKGTADMEGFGQTFSIPVTIKGKITYTTKKQN